MHHDLWGKKSHIHMLIGQFNIDTDVFILIRFRVVNWTETSSMMLVQQALINIS